MGGSFVRVCGKWSHLDDSESESKSERQSLAYILIHFENMSSTLDNSSILFFLADLASRLGYFVA